MSDIWIKKTINYSCKYYFTSTVSVQIKYTTIKLNMNIFFFVNKFRDIIDLYEYYYYYGKIRIFVVNNNYNVNNDDDNNDDEDTGKFSF